MTYAEDSRLGTVTGTTTPLQNKADLKLQLGNLTTHHTFYLADIADECILGMKPAGAVLDLGKSLMTINGEKISLKGCLASLLSSSCSSHYHTSTKFQSSHPCQIGRARESLEARMGTATLQ